MREIGKAGPWTTPADRAELDCVCWALVDLIWTHRAGCSDCAEPPETCPPVREAMDSRTLVDLPAASEPGRVSAESRMSDPFAETADLRYRTSWTAGELLGHEFPEQRYAVPGLIAEGLNLLAGAPKLGSRGWR